MGGKSTLMSRRKALKLQEQTVVPQKTRIIMGFEDKHDQSRPFRIEPSQDLKEIDRLIEKLSRKQGVRKVIKGCSGSIIITKDYKQVWTDTFQSEIAEIIRAHHTWNRTTVKLTGQPMILRLRKNQATNYINDRKANNNPPHRNLHHRHLTAVQ